jgi:hypothetical protein
MDGCAVVHEKAETDGANFDYTITLTNSSSSTASTGKFWYAWVPGEDLLASNSISVTPPTGWTYTIDHTTGGYGSFSQSSKQDLTSQVTWSSGPPTVATISNTPGTQGLVTATGAGTSAISASLDGIRR